jgi:hypothetical protein
MMAHLIGSILLLMGAIREHGVSCESREVTHLALTAIASHLVVHRVLDIQTKLAAARKAEKKAI